MLHSDGDRTLGRISGAAWTKDGGLALDIVMANTSTARTFHAERLADTRWPMYAHPVTAAPPAEDYRKLHQLVAVRLYPIASWPTAVIRIVRPPEFPIVIACAHPAAREGKLIQGHRVHLLREDFGRSRKDSHDGL